MKEFFQKYKAELIVGVGALLAGVASFFITLAVYPIQKERELAKIQPDENEMSVVQRTDVSERIDISNVQENAMTDITPVIINPEKESDNGIYIAISEPIAVEETTFDDKTIIDEESNDIMVAENHQIEEPILEEENVIEALSQKTELEFSYPISGEILLEFAKDKLVYSETLEEWITHDGIDIKGEVASPVKAVLSGIVESVKMDPRYGNTIVISHNEHLKTVYANLSTLDLVNVGKQVEKGEIISGIGEGFGFECKEGPHVHFEVIADGVAIEP